jgi:hypothetical protein
MQGIAFLLATFAFAEISYTDNVTVSTFASGIANPIGICRDGASNIFYNVNEFGPLRKFYRNGTVNVFSDKAGSGSQDCVVDSQSNIYIGIILLIVKHNAIRTK